MSSPVRNRSRRWLPVVLSVVFVIVAAGVIVVRIGAVDGPPAACATRTDFRLASSTEKSELLTKLADTYNGEPGRCGTVHVDPVSSGDAATALARGWTGGPSPRPDVWSPAASLWAGVARQSPDAAEVVPESGPSLAQSRLVFAVPLSVARRLGWPTAQLGWADLAQLSSDPRARASRGLGPTFALGKTNPEVSTSGLFALLSAFQATPGLPDVLGTGRVADPVATSFEKEIENGVVHYGNTEQEFLRNMSAAASRPGGAASYASAVAVEEKSVWDYNRGNPEALVPAPPPSAPAEPLVAFSPREGTFVSDSPYLALNWANTTDAVRTAAEDFRRWLSAPERQTVFKQNGFRDRDGHTDTELVPENGFPSTPPLVLTPPSATVATVARDLWTDSLRKPANVTLVFDTSGSMNCDEADPPPPPRSPPGSCVDGAPGHTRLDRVRSAADHALARLRQGDTLSVWTFSTPLRADATPYVVAVGPTPVGPAGSPDSAPAIAGRAFAPSFRPVGGTALYQTTRDVVETARGAADPARINAVVLLTDGEESQEPDAVSTTVDAVAADPVRPARLFFIAYSRDAGREQGAYANLERIALSSGGYTYDARTTGRIDSVFDDVVSNF